MHLILNKGNTMQTFYQILAIAAAGLIIWFLYQSIKGRPEMYSKENLNKSFSTMGILALVLIIFVAGLILLVR
jgi:hypothetical protein